jgi:hypothetical protein
VGLDWIVDRPTTRKGSMNNRFQRKYTRTQLAKSNDALDGPQQVRLFAGVPRIGNPYAVGADLDTGSWALDIDVQASSDGPLLFEITTQYSADWTSIGNFGGSADPRRQNENPILRPVDIKWGSTRFQRPIEYDRNNRAITNSAGLPYDPPVERDDSRTTLSIGRNEASFDPSIKVLYENSVNIDAFFGGNPYYWKIAAITADLAFENGLAFWRVTYNFEGRKEGWVSSLMDRGKAERVQGKLKAITDTAGVPVSDPYPLDGTGRAIPKIMPLLVNNIGISDQNFEVTQKTYTSEVPFQAFIDDEPVTVTWYSWLNNPTAAAPYTISVTRSPLPPRGVATFHGDGTMVRQSPKFRTYELYPLLPYSVLNLP